MASRRSAALFRLGSLRGTNAFRERACSCLNAQRRRAYEGTPGLVDRRDRSDRVTRSADQFDFEKRDHEIDSGAKRLFGRVSFERYPAEYHGAKDDGRLLTRALVIGFVLEFAKLCLIPGRYELKTPALDDYKKLLSGSFTWTTWKIGPPQVNWIAEHLLLGKPAELTNSSLQMLAHQLLKMQLINGDLDGTLILISSIGHIQRVHPVFRQLVEPGRRLLRKALNEQPIASVWRIVVLEGMILESRGQLDAALEMYKRAMEGQRQSLSVSKSISPAAFSKQLAASRSQNKAHYSDMILALEAPWNNAIECYRKKSELPGGNRRAMMQEARKMIEYAVAAMDVNRMRDAAVLSHRDYESEQWSDEFDKNLGMTRVPRLPENMHGTSARWLHYTTTAAQAGSGRARACCDLGRYYASMSWPFLDEEPPDAIKPTPFDRFPASGAPSLTRILTRLAQAVGIPGTRKASHEDAFHLASVPSTVDTRMKLAVDWLETAATSGGYAPALRDLLQIYAAEKISGQQSVPSKALKLSTSRYVYEDKADYWTALHDSDDDKDRTPRDVGSVSNPAFNKKKAQETVVRICHALEARRVQNAKLSSQISIEPVFTREAVEVWSKSGGFKDWCDDEEECTQLALAAQSVCEENSWKDYEDYSKLVNPRQAKSQQAEPRKVDSRQVNPRQVGPQQIKPRQVEPRKVDPRQVKPRQVNQQQIKPRQVDPRQVNPRQKQTGRTA